MTDLERLGLAVIGFMVAMIGVWIRWSGRDGWYGVLVARDAEASVEDVEDGEGATNYQLKNNQ